MGFCIPQNPLKPTRIWWLQGNLLLFPHFEGQRKNARHVVAIAWKVNLSSLTLKHDQNMTPRGVVVVVVAVVGVVGGVGVGVVDEENQVHWIHHIVFQMKQISVYCWEGVHSILKWMFFHENSPTPTFPHHNLKKQLDFVPLRLKQNMETRDRVLRQVKAGFLGWMILRVNLGKTWGGCFCLQEELEVGSEKYKGFGRWRFKIRVILGFHVENSGQFLLVDLIEAL